MVEEFYGKISRSGSNLSDNLEDKLTGDFFGTLRYMDFYDGLQPILCGALRISEEQQETSQTAIQLIENVNCTNIRDEEYIKFWPKHDLGELDVLLDFDRSISNFGRNTILENWMFCWTLIIAVLALR